MKRGATATRCEGTAGPGVVEVTIPLHLAPIGNRREHWRSRVRRVKREIAMVLKALDPHTPPGFPIVVEIERTGWNPLDPDGLVGAAKSGCIDGVAKWLRVDDRDRRIFWRLSQKTTRERRFVEDGRGRGRWETACMVRLTIRAWQPEDGDDPLRVLASPPPCLGAA
jgi:hypothetical protein